LQPLPEIQGVPHKDRPPSLPPSLPPNTQHPFHPSPSSAAVSRLFLPPVLPLGLPSVSRLSVGGLKGGRKGGVELPHQQAASRVLARDERVEGREGGREGELRVGREATADGGGEVEGFFKGKGGGGGGRGGGGGGRGRGRERGRGRGVVGASGEGG